ncbi:methyltransferase domain-containing protein [Kitasatospora purpeofusca]|uniref:methyltransferase domain-containing protein n=1 Tax=Kitasatospora purpeofusca TaxID=67352 RepID=UPI0033C7BB25
MYGEQPSEPAVHNAAAFRAVGAREVLKLGAGHSRDALYFTREDFTVLATDFSPLGAAQLREAATVQGTADRVTTAVHNVREPFPLPDASVDTVFAQMLL